MSPWTPFIAALYIVAGLLPAIAAFLVIRRARTARKAYEAPRPPREPRTPMNSTSPFSDEDIAAMKAWEHAQYRNAERVAVTDFVLLAGGVALGAVASVWSLFV